LIQVQALSVACCQNALAENRGANTRLPPCASGASIVAAGRSSASASTTTIAMLRSICATMARTRCSHCVATTIVRASACSST
jgi:hypothetical protein